ncbi:hypothetical protein GCM10027592_47980 [Spirosoma flavus]
MQTHLACQYILNELAAHLPARLTYHAVQHTHDVVQQADRIAHAEGIIDDELLALLRTAACYHDAGFLHVYADHEAESCRIAAQHLPLFGYSAGQIALVCQLIRATRLPQKPATLLEAVLCDADLDYLGRDDYWPISQLLFSEWLAFGFLPKPDQWLSIQRSFLTSHRYFTTTNQQLRETGKQQTLAALEAQQGVFHWQPAAD